MTEKILTQEILKEHLHYNPDTGVFTWIKKTSSYSRVSVGDIAGWYDYKNYLKIKILDKSHFTHRLVWLYVYGYIPKEDIDHINGIKNDNRVINLRLASNSENHQNRIVSKNNKSGYIGVSPHLNKWRSKITLNGKSIYLGIFNTPEEAHKHYVAAKSLLHTFNPVLRES